MTDPDIRFSLANERTFLAYERTAIGLVAAALAVFHLIEASVPQQLLGGLLVTSSAIAAGGGWLRFRQADKAIRNGEPLPTSPGVHLLAVAVLVCIAAAALTVLA